MSGSGQTVIPQPLVDNDDELIFIWYVYGRDAARAGFRRTNAVPSGALTMQQSNCATASGNKWLKQCGPFRMDHFTSPLWFPQKDEDITDLPPR